LELAWLSDNEDIGTAGPFDISGFPPGRFDGDIIDDVSETIELTEGRGWAICCGWDTLDVELDGNPVSSYVPIT